MNARRRAAVVLGCMGLAAGAAAMMRPRHYLAATLGKINLEKLFPERFPGWDVDARMPIVLPSPEVQAKLAGIYDQVISRAYVDARGRSVMLSVAYGGDQSDGVRVHYPEVCYPAQGFDVVSSSKSTMAVHGQPMPVRRLVARMAARVEPITYWVVVGDQIVTGGPEHKIAQLKYGLRGMVPDGMLIRLSSITGDVNAAYRTHEDFVADLLGLLDGAQERRVVGVLADAAQGRS
jgi:EpsI family protein